MKKTEYKTYLFELFDAPVDGVSYEERMALIKDIWLNIKLNMINSGTSPIGAIPGPTRN